jgi:hypothetical protein
MKWERPEQWKDVVSKGVEIESAKRAVPASQSLLDGCEVPAQYEMMLPQKGIALLYEWAVVGDKPKSVKDIFLLCMPLEVVREVDMRWMEMALCMRHSNW